MTSTRLPFRRLLALSLCLAGLAAEAPGARAQQVTTYHGGVRRLGRFEVPGLTTAAAATLTRRTDFAPALTGAIYAQPLAFRPAGKPALIIAATEANIVYGINATSGAIAWKRSLPAPAQGGSFGCGDISPEGITGAPTIDPATGTLYLNAIVATAGGAPRHRIYALNSADGSIRPGWPIDTQSALGARGFTFDSTVQGARSAILFLNGVLYVAYGGRAGDCGDYHGIVVQVAPDTATIAAHWATRARAGGIWSQAGLTSDGQAIYASTGNTFTSAGDPWGDGEAVIRLRPGLARTAGGRDYYTPANWQSLDNSDTDLGGTGAIPLDVPGTAPSPVAQRLLAFGKDGNAYLIRRGVMGGIGAELNITPVANRPIITAPADWAEGDKIRVAFVTTNGRTCSGASLVGMTVAPSGTAPITTNWCAASGGNSSPIVTTTPDGLNPVVWVLGAEGDNFLRGYNGDTGALVAKSATALAGLHRYQTLIAAYGRLYVGANNTVYAFSFTK